MECCRIISRNFTEFYGDVLYNIELFQTCCKCMNGFEYFWIFLSIWEQVGTCSTKWSDYDDITNFRQNDNLTTNPNISRQRTTSLPNQIFSTKWTFYYEIKRARHHDEFGTKSNISSTKWSLVYKSNSFEFMFNRLSKLNGLDKFVLRGNEDGNNNLQPTLFNVSRKIKKIGQNPWTDETIILY